MRRINTATKAVDLFGAGKHGFKNGDLAAGSAPTDLDADWFNEQQEELAGLVENAGLVLAPGTRTQVRSAIEILIRRRAGMVATAGGTADAITADLSPDLAALANGVLVSIRAENANATTTPTFAPDGLVAKTIVKGNNQALVAGDIAGAGHILDLQYDLTLDKWVLLNPATAVNALGFGQTVQNVTASRAISTTYTNTTGRPIFVHVRILSNTAAASSVSITVAGVVYASTTVAASGYGTQVCAIVPPGATYTASISGGGAVGEWNELR